MGIAGGATDIGPGVAKGDVVRSGVRVALVGIGRWGKHLLRVLDARCQVAICCHRNDPRVDTWLQEQYPHVKRTLDYREVLGEPTVQAVVIATPVETHFELALLALEAGKHVFVEKPLATSVGDAEQLVHTARKKGRILFVGHVFLYHPLLDTVKRLTAGDPVVYARMTWAKFGTFEEDVLWNLVSHDVAVAMELFGRRPREVALVHARAVVTACDIVTVRLGFDDGGECVLDVNRCTPGRDKGITILTAGGAVLLWAGDRLYRAGPGDALERLESGEQEPLAAEMEAFLASVKSGRPVRSDGAFGLTVVDVVSRLRASLRGSETEIWRPGGRAASVQGKYR